MCARAGAAASQQPGFLLMHVLLLPQEFFDIAVADSSVIRGFHVETNKDDTVEVSDWDEV